MIITNCYILRFTLLYLSHCTARWQPTCSVCMYAMNRMFPDIRIVNIIVSGVVVNGDEKRIRVDNWRNGFGRRRQSWVERHATNGLSTCKQQVLRYLCSRKCSTSTVVSRTSPAVCIKKQHCECCDASVKTVPKKLTIACLQRHTGWFGTTNISSIIRRDAATRGFSATTELLVFTS